MSLFADPAQSETEDLLREKPPLSSETSKSGGTQGASEERQSSTSSQTDSTALLYSEDLSVGDFWVTDCRQITETDVQSFANLTGDHTPLHDGEDSNSPFHKPIVHGLLGMSILAGLGANCPKAFTLALVGIEDWQFVSPVFFGDRVKARNEIVAIEQHGRRAVKVIWRRQLLDESGKVLQQGCFVTLVGSRSRSKAKPR